MSPATAVRIAYHFARQRLSPIFVQPTSRCCLDLEDGYRIARDWSGMTHDPAVIAKAELALVDRTADSGKSLEQVGALIADPNAQFYGAAREGA